jgi:hypothetical protein
MNNAALEKFAQHYAQAWCSHKPEHVATFYAKNGSIAVNGGTPAPILDVACSFMRDFPDMIVTFDAADYERQLREKL